MIKMSRDNLVETKFLKVFESVTHIERSPIVPDYGKQLHIPVWMPTVERHPMSGERTVRHVLCNFTDRMVTKEDAEKLNRHYNRKARPHAFD